jgi:hypothetical protein
VSINEFFWILVVPITSFLIGVCTTLICQFAHFSKFAMVWISVAVSIVLQFGFHFSYGLTRAYFWGYSDFEALRAGLSSVFWLSFGILLVAPIPTAFGSLCSSLAKDRRTPSSKI